MGTREGFDRAEIECLRQRHRTSSLYNRQKNPAWRVRGPGLEFRVEVFKGLNIWGNNSGDSWDYCNDR